MGIVLEDIFAAGKMKVFSLILLSLLLNFFLFNPETPAQYYRYVDKEGVTHFTNVPADPRYKPAPRTKKRNVSKKPKAPKRKKPPELAPPRGAKKSDQVHSD